MAFVKQRVKLPYCTRYLPGEQLELGWLKAVTSNNYMSARRLNWHDHDELELIFPLRGHYHYEFKRKRPVWVDNASFLVIPGGTQHRLNEAIDPPGGRLHLYLRNPSDHQAIRGSFSPQEFARLYQTLSGQSLKSLPASHLLKTTVSLLGKIIAKERIPLSDDDAMQARFLCCLTLCLSAAAKKPAIANSTSKTFAEATNWLKSNYSTAIRMDQLIEHIGYSRARFFDLFKQQTNMTPSEYLRNYRLEKAKEMLIQTDIPVFRIGKNCGLGDPAHFSRLFSKMTGYTPLAYRHANRNEASNTPKPDTRQTVDSTAIGRLR